MRCLVAVGIMRSLRTGLASVPYSQVTDRYWPSKRSRRERNFWMQRPGAKNRPERLRMSQRPKTPNKAFEYPRGNGLFPIEDGFDGLGRLNGGVRSHMRTRLSGDSTLKTAAIRCFPLSLVKTGNSN